MPVETLVDGYTYLVLPDGESAQLSTATTGGLYHQDTRYLSTLEWATADAALRSLQSTLQSPAVTRELLAPVETTVNAMSGETVPKHTDIVLALETGVHEGAGCSQTITVHNHTATTRTVPLTVHFDADYADIFEVRGVETDIDRTVRTTVSQDTVQTAYSFEDNGEKTEYTTTLSFSSPPDSLSEHEATIELTVPPQGTASCGLTVGIDGADPPTDTEQPDRNRPIELPVVPTATDTYDDVLRQAAADLAALTTETEHGPIALAGTPWFVTPFGRDALITALQTLPVAPALALGTLRYLAAHRGTSTDPITEEEPGKIFHEQRQGELAHRGLIPHTPYYGTVDATPLWILLLKETCTWTGSLAPADELAATLADTLDWVYTATRTGPEDPFIYYDSSDHALTHKAWKDTADSIRNTDGTPADRPLAVAEVQGYAAAALTEGAELLTRLQDRGVTPDTAEPPDAYRSRAEAIETAFTNEFWLPERSFYAVAKTGDGDIVDSITSNVGHCLWTGLIDQDHVEPVAETLLGTAMRGGWGLRTMSADDAGYSPVSYHAGGIWPHDTSLAALGLAEHGYADEAERLGRHVLDAAATFKDQRLPELYCGFARRDPPTPYPAACTPQAWGAGAPFAILRATVGLRPDKNGHPTVTRSSDLFAASVIDQLTEEAASSTRLAETSPND